MRIFLLIVAIIIGLAALGFISDSLNLFSYKFFAPKYEAARREVFVNTPSYVLGKTQYLSKQRLEYEESKDDDVKKALRKDIVNQLADIDANDIKDSDLRNFLIEMRNTH